jgi:hypothetical protein
MPATERLIQSTAGQNQAVGQFEFFIPSCPMKFGGPNTEGVGESEPRSGSPRGHPRGVLA